MPYALCPIPDSTSYESLKGYISLHPRYPFWQGRQQPDCLPATASPGELALTRLLLRGESEEFEYFFDSVFV